MSLCGSRLPQPRHHQQHHLNHHHILMHALTISAGNDTTMKTTATATVTTTTTTTTTAATSTTATTKATAMITMMMTSLLKMATRALKKTSHAPRLLPMLTVLCMTLTLTPASVSASASGSEVNPGTTLQCHVREYSYPVQKRPMLNQRGQVVTCEGVVRVNTCWGRCDSYEVGDFQMPFKVSHHPVCTYAGYTRRLVTLQHCDEGYPDPTVEVLEATACACRPCDSTDTSCENLDG